MKKFKMVLTILAVFCSIYLAIWSFQGNLPPWAGGLAWLFLALGHIRELFVVEADYSQAKWMSKELQASLDVLKEKQCKKD